MQLNHCEKSISTLALMIITMPEARYASLPACQLQVNFRDNRNRKTKENAERPFFVLGKLFFFISVLIAACPENNSSANAVKNANFLKDI